MTFDIKNLLDPQEQITALYVGYFGRSPDPIGLSAWLSRLEEHLNGAVAFVSHQNQVFQIMGIGSPDGWTRDGTRIRDVLGTFAQVNDPAVLNVQPSRIEIIRVPDAMTLEQFYSRYPTSLELDEVAQINRRSPGELIPAGTLMKHVEGRR